MLLVQHKTGDFANCSKAGSIQTDIGTCGHVDVAVQRIVVYDRVAFMQAVQCPVWPHFDSDVLVTSVTQVLTGLHTAQSLAGAIPVGRRRAVWAGGGWQ